MCFTPHPPPLWGVAPAPGGQGQAGPAPRGPAPAHSLPPAPTRSPACHSLCFCKLAKCIPLELHLYICLFFIFKTCFLDKFINILAGALSPCKSLSPTHMPTLPARLHSSFGTCTSHVGDPLVMFASLSLSLSLSLPTPPRSFSHPLASSPHLSCAPLQRVRTHFTALQMSRFPIHFTACASQSLLIFSPHTASYGKTFISLPCGG